MQQIKKVGSMNRGAQGGFTLIELIVVIVILGILAATALPKFIDMGADARLAKIKGARGAVSSAAGIVHAKWLMNGSPTAVTNVLVDGGVEVETNGAGFPTAAGIVVAAGLDANEYSITGTAPVVIATDTNHTGCSFNYAPASGAVGSAPAASSSC